MTLIEASRFAHRLIVAFDKAARPYLILHDWNVLPEERRKGWTNSLLAAFQPMEALSERSKYWKKVALMLKGMIDPKELQ